jgi:hypothetical protein
MSKNIEISKPKAVIATDTTKFEQYLEFLELPTDNILASYSQRQTIETNLVGFISTLDEETKRDGRYLSKFVAASSIGLFDAALNYVWNEVVINLRKKAVIYGLEFFFDAAVGGSKREDFTSEDDLSGIKDNALINTCYKLELISEIVSTKLHHILTMRNDIGSSHPNTYSINAFELLGWLETCVTDVLNDKPSKAAIQIKSFVDNLKTTETILDSASVLSMEKPLKELSLQNTDNLLNNIFGIFVSDKSGSIIRKNIAQIAPFIWSHSSESIKYKLGIMLDGYKNNLYHEKHALGLEFFTFCDGNKYQSLEAKIISIDELSDDLLEARYGWDNFQNEPPYIRKILTYFETENDIPKERIEKLIKVVLICRIGKGISYNHGVSPNGKILYDRFFKLLGDNNILQVLEQMHSYEVRVKIDNRFGQDNMIEILNILKENAVSERLHEIIDFLLSKKTLLHKIHNDKDYKDIAGKHINLDK